MDVIYLKKGERRPRGERAILINCRSGLRNETIEATPIGDSMTIQTDDLKRHLASLEQKGVKKVYVRIHDNG